MLIDEHKRTLKRLIQEANEGERMARSSQNFAAADAFAEYSSDLDDALTELKVVETEIA